MSGRLHTCDWCGRTSTWSEGYSAWGTADDTVFTCCSDECAAKIEPSTKFIGKPQSFASGKWFRQAELDKARLDLERRKAAANG